MRLLARQDLPGLADLAHRVKGGALIIRAKGLIAACEALESACRGGDRPLLAAAVDEVRQAMDQLTERLQAYVAGKPAPAGPRRGPLGPDRKSTRLNSSHSCASRMPSSA